MSIPGGRLSTSVSLITLGEAGDHRHGAGKVDDEGQDLNPARPGKKSGRYSLITGAVRPDCDQQQRARSLKSGIPARSGARPRGVRGRL